MTPKIIIETNIVSLIDPVTPQIVDEATKILNFIFNLDEFEQELSKQTFFCTNRPSFCKNCNEILGADVYSDFIPKKKIEVSVTVTRLRGWWKRHVYKTMGETDPAGCSIITYHWWLDYNSKMDLIISYATHIGHEIFHTNYFGYIHNPSLGSKKFVNEKDVTYMIDDILEKLIRVNYK